MIAEMSDMGVICVIGIPLGCLIGLLIVIISD